jgi:transposase
MHLLCMRVDTVDLQSHPHTRVRLDAVRRQSHGYAEQCHIHMKCASPRALHLSEMSLSALMTTMTGTRNSWRRTDHRSVAPPVVR